MNLFKLLLVVFALELGHKLLEVLDPGFLLVEVVLLQVLGYVKDGLVVLDHLLDLVVLSFNDLALLLDELSLHVVDFYHLLHANRVIILLTLGLLLRALLILGL